MRERITIVAEENTTRCIFHKAALVEDVHNPLKLLVHRCDLVVIARQVSAISGMSGKYGGTAILCGSCGAPGRFTIPRMMWFVKVHPKKKRFTRRHFVEKRIYQWNSPVARRVDVQEIHPFRRRSAARDGF